MSGEVAEPGAWPARAGATASAAKRQANLWIMSVVRMDVRAGGDLGGRGVTGRQSVAQGQVHDFDLLMLRDDDLLGQPLQALVLAVAELDERHVDGALVVRDHHACEVTVSIAGEGHVHRRGTCIAACMRAVASLIIERKVSALSGFRSLSAFRSVVRAAGASASTRRTMNPPCCSRWVSMSKTSHRR